MFAKIDTRTQMAASFFLDDCGVLCHLWIDRDALVFSFIQTAHGME